MPTTGTGSGTQSPVSVTNLPSKVAIVNPLQVDVFDPQRQPFIRWIQRLEGAFRVFQILEDTERVAYLLHFVDVELFGILCDQLDPVDPYTQSYNTLIKKLKKFYALKSLEIENLHLPKEYATHGRECTRIYGHSSKIIITLQIWRIFADGISEPICIWPKESANSIKAVGDSKLNKGFSVKNCMRYGVGGERS